MGQSHDADLNNSLLADHALEKLLDRKLAPIYVSYLASVEFKEIAKATP